MTKIEKEILEVLQDAYDERARVWDLYDDGSMDFEQMRFEFDTLCGRIDGLTCALDIVRCHLDV